MNRNLYLIFTFFIFQSCIINAQCSYTGLPLTQAGTDHTFCIDNGTITTATVRSGQFVVLNIIRGFTYTFSVGNVFNGGGNNENLTLLNAVDNTNLGASGFSSGSNGTTISNWTAPFSGQIKILLSRAGCINDNTAGGALTLSLISVGNTQDSQTTFGTNQWIGHVYNFTGGPPPGGTSPTTPSTTTSPFLAANYVGDYSIPNETISEGFGGNLACFPIMSNGSVRATMYTELFAVRYRMRSTKEGCYLLNMTGDDGIRLYIDGVLVFNEWREQSPTNYCNNLIYLSGSSDLVLDFYENQGQNVINFSLTPFVPAANNIAGASVINRCSGVAPGTLDGSVFTYCASGTNPNITFQWQISSDNISFTNIAGATTEDYAPPALTTATNTVRFYRRVLGASASNAGVCQFFTNVIRVNTSASTALSATGVISGITAQCPVSANQIYSVAAVTNALNYAWTVPTGWTITAGQGTNSLTVTTGVTGQNNNISVTASNGCNTNAIQSLAVTVVANNTTGSPSSNPTLCVNTILTPITRTTTGATGIGLATGLPAGVTASWVSNSIIISGTPTASGIFNYTIPLTGGCGSVNATGTITVTANTTAGIASSSPTLCVNTTLIPITRTTTGATGIGLATGLPAGVTASWASNSITVSGTPTTAGIFNYSIPLTGGCGGVNALGTITVNARPATSVISASASICSGSSTNLQVAITGGASPYLAVYTTGSVSSYTTGANIPVSPTSTTTYSLTSVTDANGCVGTGNSGSAVVTIDVTTSTNGGSSWSNGTPTSSKSVVFDGSTGTIGNNFAACSLRLINNATVSVTAGFDVTLEGKLTVDSGSTFTLNNNANLIQNTTITNTGNIVVNRNSSLLKRLDYTLWSSPVTSQGLYAFSKFTLPNRFYVYNSNTNLYNNSVGFSLTGLQYPSPLVSPNGVNGTDSNTVQFSIGQGYLIRVPWNHPTTATVFNATFTGVPNNGNYSFTLFNGGAGQRFNLVGNPYPSPIDATAFVQNASNMLSTTGTLYFWRKTNNALSPSYCTWNLGGFVTNGEAQVFDPNDVIQTGQGFFVEGSGSGSVNFDNTMRISNHANQFFRNSNVASTNSIERNRIWLNATSTNGSFSQTMFGYMTNATQGVDATIDGKYINEGDIALTSLIDNAPYAIQGRALPFDTSDIVPMNFKATTSGNYTIAIDHVDGLFMASSQSIYLKDNLTTTVHDLNSGGYTFATAAGTFSSRFEIVYQTQLVNPTFTANAVIIYNQNNAFVVNSGNTIMNSIKVFDVRGRLLQEKNNINASQTTIGSGLVNQVLLVQITSDFGVVVTKKVVRQI